ncbi:hypothetical protein ACP70R_005984 [Stipagrostis hirtigluma subsp. patula]
MARRTVLLGLFLGLLAATNAVPFDFYYLILSWPGAYCEDSDNGCCVPEYGYPSEDFFVNSFITFDLSTNKAAVRCRNGSPFDLNKLDPIENNLNHYWSNIKCPRTDGTSTWKRAWNSYGVCSGLKQVDYFRSALALRRQADVLAALAEQGVKPDYKLYSTEKIRWSVRQKLGVAPGLQCRDGPFGRKQLWEVYLCVDTDAKTFVECPKLPAGVSCPAQAVFHPFYTWMLNATAAFEPRIRLPTDAMN